MCPCGRAVGSLFRFHIGVAGGLSHGDPLKKRAVRLKAIISVQSIGAWFSWVSVPDKCEKTVAVLNTNYFLRLSKIEQRVSFT